MKYISDSSWLVLQEVTAECRGNFYNPASDNCENKLAKVYDVRIHLLVVPSVKIYSITPHLDLVFTFISWQTQDVNSLNIYNILEPCYHGTKALDTILGNTKLPSSFRKLGETERPLPVRKRMFGRAWPYQAPVRDGIVPTWPQILNSGDVPCIVSDWSYYTCLTFTQLI